MLKPVGQNILFKPFHSPEISEGGLYVPETAREVSNKGTIVAVGSQVKKVKEGDVGFRVKNWGDEILIDGEKHYIMKEDAILSLI